MANQPAIAEADRTVTGAPDGIMPIEAMGEMPIVREITTRDVWEALWRGVDDFKAMPTHAVFLVAERRRAEPDGLFGVGWQLGALFLAGALAGPSAVVRRAQVQAQALGARRPLVPLRQRLRRRWRGSPPPSSSCPQSGASALGTTPVGDRTSSDRTPTPRSCRRPAAWPPPTRHSR